MASPKTYTKQELRQLRKKGMIKILKDDYGYLDRATKLGYTVQPYIDEIWSLQSARGDEGDSKNRNNNNKSKSNKLFAASTSKEFEKEKTRVAKATKKRKKKRKKRRKGHNDMEVSSSDSDESCDGSDDGYYGNNLQTIDGFAESVNTHYSKQIFTAQYLESVKGEGMGLAEFQTLLVEWRQNRLLTDKSGDFKMRTGDVMKISDFFTSQQSEAMDQCKGSGGSGVEGTDIKNAKPKGKGTDLKLPFLGNAKEAPDYVGMIRFVTDDSLKNEDISVVGRIHYKNRNKIWLEFLCLLRQFKELESQQNRNKSKRIILSSLYEKNSKTYGDHKYLWALILYSPGMIEDVYSECGKRLSGKNVLDLTRNKLADVYGQHKHDLSRVKWAFPDGFVGDFHRCLGDFWAPIKEWYETSVIYQEYIDENY